MKCEVQVYCSATRVTHAESP